MARHARRSESAKQRCRGVARTAVSARPTPPGLLPWEDRSPFRVGRIRRLPGCACAWCWPVNRGPRPTRIVSVLEPPSEGKAAQALRDPGGGDALPASDCNLLGDLVSIVLASPFDALGRVSTIAGEPGGLGFSRLRVLRRQAGTTVTTLSFEIVRVNMPKPFVGNVEAGPGPTSTAG